MPLKMTLIGFHHSSWPMGLINFISRC
uniref:Uncharacterized protein n=1 Tax=Rhizophora mucronata TaxID=61149 RepID=A0A2P2N646_RHIMU